MSEERFDRIESQIAQLRELLEQNMLATQPNTSEIDRNISGIDRSITSLNQNLKALREDLLNLRHRIDSIAGTQNLMIREGFKSLMPYNDDLNYELSDNARQTRLLRRRVIWLEGKDKEDK
jgi:chromosome segregation ATPase